VLLKDFANAFSYEGNPVDGGVTDGRPSDGAVRDGGFAVGLNTIRVPCWVGTPLQVFGVGLKSERRWQPRLCTSTRTLPKPALGQMHLVAAHILGRCRTAGG